MIIMSSRYVAVSRCRQRTEYFGIILSIQVRTVETDHTILLSNY